MHFKFLMFGPLHDCSSYHQFTMRYTQLLSLAQSFILQDNRVLCVTFYCADVGGMEGDHANEAYDYVPGAGDDEESWARGLTPELFWQHKQVSLLLFLSWNAGESSFRVCQSGLGINIHFQIDPKRR